MAKKYIDAEKLKAHIEAKMEILWDKLPDADKEHPTDIELRDLGMYMALEGLIDDLDSLQQEQEEIDLEKFTEKMDAWKARYNYPDNFSIKATMAFTARMFYMYPQVAREWYDSLPKVSLD